MLQRLFAKLFMPPNEKKSLCPCKVVNKKLLGKNFPNVVQCFSNKNATLAEMMR